MNFLTQPYSGRIGRKKFVLYLLLLYAIWFLIFLPIIFLGSLGVTSEFKNLAQLALSLAALGTFCYILIYYYLALGLCVRRGRDLNLEPILSLVIAWSGFGLIYLIFAKGKQN